MSRPKMPEQPPLPEQPKVSDPKVQEALAESVRRQSRKRGFQSTILFNRMMDEPTQTSMTQPGKQQTFGS